MCLFKPKIRTRFAPSPTGQLHVGGLKTALYAYLFAKQNKGVFFLRLEDTDQTREIPGAVENLLKSLKWVGIEPDGGIILDKSGKIAEKGKFGPYTQSKRLPIYQKYAQKLVAQGSAYYCFCSPERLETLRRDQEASHQPTRYDWHCRYLLPDEIKIRLDKGDKYVIRLKVPENRIISFIDLVRGQVTFNSREIDDQVLLKADGFPTYHLAHVVDDYLMKTSHIIRGEEWLSSTPKHLLLFEFLNWPAPHYAHLPLILNADKSKLSKRQGDVAVEDYRCQGYLPEALINFVAFLGWNPGTEQEIFSLPELVKAFSFQQVHKAGAIFNSEKLDWMNSVYIKKLPLEKFTELATPYLFSAHPYQGGAEPPKGAKGGVENLKKETIKKIFALEQTRVSKLSEVGQGIEFLFQDQLNYDAKLLIWKKSDLAATKRNLSLVAEEFKNYQSGDWNKEILEKKLKEFIAKNNLTNGEILWPLRVALTGLEKSPTPFEVAEILGKNRTLKRISEAIEKLNHNIPRPLGVGLMAD